MAKKLKCILKERSTSFFFSLVVNNNVLDKSLGLLTFNFKKWPYANLVKKKFWSLLGSIDLSSFDKTIINLWLDFFNNKKVWLLFRPKQKELGKNKSDCNPLLLKSFRKNINLNIHTVFDSDYQYFQFPIFQYKNKDSFSLLRRSLRCNDTYIFSDITCFGKCSPYLLELDTKSYNSFLQNINRYPKKTLVIVDNELVFVPSTDLEALMFRMIKKEDCLVSFNSYGGFKIVFSNHIETNYNLYSPQKLTKNFADYINGSWPDVIKYKIINVLLHKLNNLIYLGGEFNITFARYRSLMHFFLNQFNGVVRLPIIFFKLHKNYSKVYFSFNKKCLSHYYPIKYIRGAVYEIFQKKS